MDKSFTHNNKSFGATYLRTASSEEKAAEGISWETPVEPPVIRPPLEHQKTDAVARAKDTANKLLSSSDWQVIAKTERGREIPEEVSSYRAGVIAETARLELAYLSATEQEQFDEVKQNWPLTALEKEMLKQEESSNDA
tara:strand:+ start:22214 stop:22630 length:417 start_codon:yes stop_codon:yes gene_type:complete